MYIKGKVGGQKQAGPPCRWLMVVMPFMGGCSWLFVVDVGGWWWCSSLFISGGGVPSSLFVVGAGGWW